jgi:hypothetical protein
MRRIHCLEPDHAVTYARAMYLLDRNPKQAKKDFDKALKLDRTISLFGVAWRGGLGDRGEARGAAPGHAGRQVPDQHPLSG